MPRPLIPDFDMTPSSLIRRMRLGGISDARLADLLGSEVSVVRAWRLGHRPIPKYVGAFFEIFDPDADTETGFDEVVRAFGVKEKEISPVVKRMRPLDD